MNIKYWSPSKSSLFAPEYEEYEPEYLTPPCICSLSPSFNISIPSSLLSCPHSNQLQLQTNPFSAALLWEDNYHCGDQVSVVKLTNNSQNTVVDILIDTRTFITIHNQLDYSVHTLTTVLLGWSLMYDFNSQVFSTHRVMKVLSLCI